MYEKQDMWRTKKWALANPKTAEKQNIEQLKKLIVINLTKPKPKPRKLTKESGNSPIMSLAEIRRRKLAKKTKAFTHADDVSAETVMNASSNSSIMMASRQ